MTVVYEFKTSIKIRYILVSKKVVARTVDDITTK